MINADEETVALTGTEPIELDMITLKCITDLNDSTLANLPLNSKR